MATRLLALILAAGLTSLAQPGSTSSIRSTTFLGRGGALARPSGVAVGPSGDIWVAGVALWSGFPTVNAIQESHDPGGCLGPVPPLGPCGDLFLARLQADGRGARFSTYLGGARDESVSDLAVDEAGNAYLVGFTESEEFPFNRDFGAGADSFRRPFLLKISPAGQIVYAAALPSALSPRSVAADSRGAAYVGGTVEGDLQQVGGLGLDPVPAAPNGLLLKVDAAGSRIEYLTVLGGGSTDSVDDLAVDATGRVYATGATSSADFPVTAQLGPHRPGMDYDAYLAVVSPGGDRIEWAAYIGGSGNETSNRIALGRDGAVILSGTTASPDFPLQNPISGELPDGGGAWVASVLPSENRFEYAGYLEDNDLVDDLAADKHGAAYLAGTRTVMTADGFVTSGFILRVDPSGLVVSRTPETVGALAVTEEGSLVGASYGSSGILNPRFALDADAVAVSMIDLQGDSGDQPQLLAIVNAADLLAHPLTPGTVVSLYGRKLGPADGAAVAPTDGSFPNEFAGVRVFFGEQAAPLLYVSEGQINAVTPQDLGELLLVPIRVEREGVASNRFTLTTAPADGAIFAMGATWPAPAAALNADGTLNTPDNPARSGSIVTIFATGVGALTPALADGEVAPLEPPFPSVADPLDVQLDGGTAAAIAYAGAAPGIVAGAAQINFLIPADYPGPGPLFVSLRTNAGLSRPLAFFSYLP
jgi:uncharacterized protein (TIGR03437 family)